MRRYGPAAATLATLALAALGADDPPPTPAPSPPNLLVDGSFEAGPAGWRAGSWRVPASEVVIDPGQAREGHASATIRIEGPADDARAARWVKVEAGRRYRASGWVKTAGVAHREPGSTFPHVGANLCLMNRAERSESLFGDHDWTELSFEFEPGPSVEVEFAARLGSYSSTVTGLAWFDDLRLVDVGPGRVAPPMMGDDRGPMPAVAAPVPPPAPAWDSLWAYALSAIVGPLVLAASLAGVARARGLGPRAAAGWVGAAAAAFGVGGLLFGAIVGIGAVPLGLIALGLLLPRPAGSIHAGSLDLAPGEVGDPAKAGEPVWGHLAPLAFGMVLVVASSPFLTATILSLLAMPVLLAGVVVVGLALAFLPGPAKGPESWTARLGGGLLLGVGLVAMMAVLFYLAGSMCTRGARPTGNEAQRVVVMASAGWLMVVGLLRVALGLRGADDRLANPAAFVMLGAWPLVLGLGHLAWPWVPTSL